MGRVGGRVGIIGEGGKGGEGSMYASGGIQQRQHLEPKMVSFFLLNKKLNGHDNLPN